MLIICCSAVKLMDFILITEVANNTNAPDSDFLVDVTFRKRVTLVIHHCNI